MCQIMCPIFLVILGCSGAQDSFLSAVAKRQQQQQQIAKDLGQITVLRENLGSKSFRVREEANASVLYAIKCFNRKYPWAKRELISALATDNPDTEVHYRLQRLASQALQLKWDNNWYLIPQRNVLLSDVIDELSIMLGKSINYEADLDTIINIIDRDPVLAICHIANQLGKAISCSSDSVGLRDVQPDLSNVITPNTVTEINAGTRRISVGSVSNDIKVIDIIPIQFTEGTTPWLVHADGPEVASFTCQCDGDTQCQHTISNCEDAQDMSTKKTHVLSDEIHRICGKSLMRSLEPFERLDFVCLVVAGGRNFQPFDCQFLAPHSFRRVGIQTAEFEKEKQEDGSWKVFITFNIHRMAWSLTTFTEDRIYHSLILANEYEFYHGDEKLVGKMLPVHFRETGTFLEQYAFVVFTFDNEPTRVRGRMASELFAEYLEIPND